MHLITLFRPRVGPDDLWQSAWSRAELEDLGRHAEREYGHGHSQHRARVVHALVLPHLSHQADIGQAYTGHADPLQKVVRIVLIKRARGAQQQYKAKAGKCDDGHGATPSSWRNLSSRALPMSPAAKAWMAS